MSEHPAEDQTILTVFDEQGAEIQCQLVEVIVLEGKQYGVLLKLTVQEKDEEPSLVIMRMVTRGDTTTFQDIEEEEEFARVVGELDKLAAAREAE